MILRILGEGQLRMSDEAVTELNELDEVLIDAVEKGDEGQFKSALANLVDKARGSGNRWPMTTSDRRSSSFPAPTPPSTRCGSCYPTRV